MSLADRERWDAKYAVLNSQQPGAPDQWLIEQVAQLAPGNALELACGLGHNAVALAQSGWQVDAVDISPVGLAVAEKFARSSGLKVNWIAADLEEFQPEFDYDLIVVFRYLDRSHLPSLVENHLKPGGRLVYETFTSKHLCGPDSHMKNPAFALLPGELPSLFPSCAVGVYAECSLPNRDVARFVGIRK